MSYLHLTRTRTRERTPDHDNYYTRPLARRDSNKRRHSITLSDLDDADDYPYSTNQKPAKLSRALTVRDQPSQLERYNIVRDNRHNHKDFAATNQGVLTDTLTAPLLQSLKIATST
jgi:hypothetical protein